jgi:hypothetical protein
MFRLVDRPTLMPARTLTGSTTGPVIDTEVILRNGGRVYVSPLEGWEIVVKDPGYETQIGIRASELGWLSPDAYAALLDRITDLEEQLAYAQAGQPKVVSLEDALKLVDAAAAA